LASSAVTLAHGKNGIYSTIENPGNPIIIFNEAWNSVKNNVNRLIDRYSNGKISKYALLIEKLSF
jgi:hypothetical protein